MKKINNVYGVIGIRAIDSNWNAGFDGNPKSLPDGTIFGSDKSLKYSIRKFWQLQGEKVLYIKTKKKTADGMADITLEERYTKLFGKKPANIKDKVEILKDILTAIDARQFGFTFAVSQKNLNATGPVQIGIGRNIYNKSAINYQDILSPFTSGEGKDKSSIGQFITVDHVDYCYPFLINPTQLDFDGIDEELGHYTEEDFELFLKAAANGANALNSCTKAGANNSYVIVVEAIDDKLFLNNLATYLSLLRNELMLGSMMNYLSTFSNRIKSIKIYYDDTTITVGEYENLEKHHLSELQ